MAVAIVSACGGAAMTNSVADAEQGSRRASASGDAWSGQYNGRTDGGEGFLDVQAAQGPGNYNVAMTIAGSGCAGDAAGPGRVVNGRLVVNASTPSGEQCTLEFARTGSSLRSTEAGGCYQLHGPSCDFTGTLRRTGAVAGGSNRPSAQSGGRSQPRNAATEYAELVAATENGGAPGCFDPSLRGRERAVAERLSGVPCGGSSAAAPARGGSWIVGGWYASSGDWSASADNCVGNGVTFESGGTYYAVNESGRWSLAGNVLTMVATHETDGESNFPLRQPRRTSVSVAPLPNGRMSWRVGNRPARVMSRCQTD